MLNHVIGNGFLLVPQKRVVVAVNNAFSPFGWFQHRKRFKGNVFEEIINNPVTIITEPFVALDREVIQPLYREVIQPVGKALEKVGQGIAKDPVTFLAQVAAVAAAPMTGGASLWALPVIAAASTAAHGGSLEQILTATAISAASAVVGGALGPGTGASGWIMNGLSTASEFGPSFAIAGNTIAFSTAQTIAQVGAGLSMAAINAAGAAIQGRDPLAAAIPAVVGTAAGAAVNTLASTEIFQDLGRSINDLGTNVSPVVQRAMTGVVSSAVSGAMAGRDPSGSIAGYLATGLVEGLYSTVDVVGNLFKNDAGNITKYGAATQSLIANLAGTVAATAAQSGPMGNEFSGKLTQSITSTLGSFLSSGYDALATEVKGLFDNTTKVANTLNTAATNQQNLYTSWDSAYKSYETKYASMQSLYDQQDRLMDQYMNATTQSEINRIGAELSNVQNQLRAGINELNGLDATIDNYASQYLASQKTTEAAQKEYYELAKLLGTKSELLTSKTNEIAKAATEKLVKDLDPNFNADEYKKVNNLGSGVDAFTDWMARGKDLGLPTNVAAAQQEIQDNYSRLAKEIIQKQWGTAWEPPAAMVKELQTKLYQQYGNNLALLKEATVDNVTTAFGAVSKTIDGFLPAYNSQAAKDYQLKQSINEAITPGWYQPKDYKMPEGMKYATQQDIAEMMATGAKIYTGTDSNGYTVYLKQDPNYTPIAKYNKDTGEIEPTASVLNDMVTLQNMSSTDKVKFLAKMSQQTSDYLEKTAPELAQTAGYAKTIMDTLTSDSTPNWLKSTVSSFVGAAGSVVSMNALPLSKIADYIGLAEGANTASDVYKWGQAMQKAANALTPEEYKDGVNQANAIIDNAKGFFGTLGAFKDVAGQYSAEVATTVVAKELFEEVLQYPIERAGYAAGAGLAAAMGLTGPAALALAAGAGISTAIWQNMNESFTGGYESVMSKLTEEGMKRGLTKDQAMQQAEPFAIEAGLKDTGVTAVLEGITKNSLAKFMFRNTPDAAQDALVDKFIDVIKVGVAESGKEGFENMFQSISQANIINTLYAGTMEMPDEAAKGLAWGTIVGGPVGGTMAGVVTGADVISQMTAFGNSQLGAQLVKFQNGNYTMGELGSVLDKWIPPTAAADQVAGEQSLFDSIRAAVIPEVLSSNPNFANQYSTPQAYMDAVKNALGVWEVPVLADIANTVPKFAGQVTTAEEAKQMLVAQGLTNVTVQDAVNAGLVGQTKANQNDLAQQYANAQMVSEAEVRAAAQQENYAITKDELDILVGRGVQADVIANFIRDIDPKAVTTAEATQYFKDLGYNKATAADIAQFVKSAPESEVTKAVAEWVDPRQVTRSEAINFYAQLGYVPSEAEIAQYVVHGPEIVQANIQKQLEEYVDPRYVTAEEVRQAYKDMGLNAPVAASDVARLSGQYAETDLAGKAKEALPVVSANAVYALMAGEPSITQTVKQELLTKIDEYKNIGLTESEANKAAIQSVAAQLGTTQTNLLNAIGATEQNLLIKISNTEANLAAKIEEYKAQGLTQQAATQKALDEMATSLGTTKEDLLTKIGATEENLYTQISGVRQELLDKIDLYQQQGMTQQAATQKALDELSANLGTTKEDLLAQIGATETNLLTKLKEYQDTTAEKFVGIESNIAATKQTIMDQMAAYEKAGIDRDTALDLAIAGVSQDLGVAKSDLLAQMGTTEQALRQEMTTQSTQLKQEIQDVATLVGKPASQVTQQDIDYVNSIIGGTQQQNLAYDVNQDGKVDQKDLTLIQQQQQIEQNQNVKMTTDPTTGLNVYTDATTGQQITGFSPSAGTPWAPTGIYAALEQQKAQQAATAKAQAETAAKTAKEAQQKQQFNQMMQMMLTAPDVQGQQVTTSVPDPGQIKYFYDWSSIFANPTQAQMMPSPYGALNVTGPQAQKAANQPMFRMASGFAGGGIVGNDIEVGDGGSVDDLINILKGNG